MSVTSTTLARIQYNGDGSTTTFPSSFVFQLNTDLNVLETNNTTGVITTMVLNTDYTVTGGGGTSIPTTGNVIMTTAPAVGVTLTIQRVTPDTQLDSFPNNQPLDMGVIEGAFDKLTLVNQDNVEALSRAILFQPGTTGVTSVTLGQPVPTYTLQWDSTGTILNSVPFNGTQIVTTVVGTVSNPINQSNHGFTIGQVLNYNGTLYSTAIASSSSGAETIGMVTSVVDANNFVLSNLGYVTGLTGLLDDSSTALTAGQVYFLSDSSAGKLTHTAPSTVGHVNKPIFQATSSSTGYLIESRGIIVSTPLAAAVKSDQVTGTSTTVFTNPGVQQNHLSAVKAWVNWTKGGTTINASYNVASITRTAAGNYTITFANAMADTNYVASITAVSASTALSFNVVAANTGTLQIEIYSVGTTPALVDPSGNIMVMIVGNM